MTDKEKYTQKLIDAVGEIDDRYIYEAQNYTPKKRMPGYIAAVIAAAASMFLIIGLSLPLAFSLLMKSGSGSALDANYEKPLEQMTQSMSKADVKAYETLPDIKGAAIIWHTDAEGYSFVNISESTAQSIIESIGDGGGMPAKDDGTRVWIKTDAGFYVSPQLKRSPGNTDCAIFEYSPEIAISDKAAQMITKIIDERG